MVKREKEQALIVSQTCIGTEIYSMWIQTKAALTAKAGQFIAIFTNDGTKLLPRPISICENDPAGERLRVVYRVTGEETGTKQFSLMKAGDMICVIGPLGNGFPLLSKKALLIGGGIGVPPMLQLAKELSCQKAMVAGYRDELFLKEDFESQCDFYVATEDGSAGTKGNVMDVIDEHQICADVIYACGPTPMLRAVKQYATEHDIECYVSMEEHMACGIGACLACVCKTKEVDHHSRVNNKRICKDGPVFLAGEVEL